LGESGEIDGRSYEIEVCITVKVTLCMWWSWKLPCVFVFVSWCVL